MAPGNSIGTLTLAVTPTLGGTTSMEINKSGTSLTGGKLVVTSGTLAYGGTLTVAATGDALTEGDTFDLFDASAFSGSFSATNLPSLTAGLEWNTSQLTVNGTIFVACMHATADAGLDRTVCTINPNGFTVNLTGCSIGGSATSATWSGGTGSFEDIHAVVDNTYSFSPADIAAGTVTLTLTTDDPPGNCPAVSDSMTFTINPRATVNAGPDQTIYACDTVTLAGSIGGSASSATWSGGAGSFSPNNTTLNAIYTPSPGEVAAGTVTLTLTTDNPVGPCGAVSDTMTVTINPYDNNHDTDGDGLTDAEELNIWIDTDNHGLGHLDPLNPDTGSTGTADGDKDSDHDLISNLAELRKYGSLPSNAHTFNNYKTDAQYFFLSSPVLQDLQPDDPTTETKCRIASVNIGGYLFKVITIISAPANRAYDLYFIPEININQPWTWRRIYSGSPGQMVFTFRDPTWAEGCFVMLSAEDDDGDGLSNGYETWFTYNGQHTSVSQPDSDGDELYDGWEVEYGLYPTDNTGIHGKYGNPDGDEYNNKIEFQEYDSNFYGSYDPLKVFNTPANRPVISVEPFAAAPSCEEASFTINRSGGHGADYSQSLTVYYAVGGTLQYGTDYTLNPAPYTEPGDPDHPDGYPRIFLATIPPNQQSVPVTVTLVGHPVTSGVKTFIAKLTPYSVSRETQVPAPAAWNYVVDLQGNDETTINFDYENFRPRANDQLAQTCPQIPKEITLTGEDGCNDPLTFAKVTGPSHGDLGLITPIDATSASVTYTPWAGFCGQDSFTFKVNDGLRDSAPATITVNVGDPNPQAHCRDVITGISPSVASIILSGLDGCNNTLTFTPVTAPGHGSLGAITPIDSTHASVTYTPTDGFEGIDGFDFTVGSCGFVSAPVHVTIYVVRPPLMTATCGTDRIQLLWAIPSWLDGVVSDFCIKRSITPGGPYDQCIATVGATARSYADIVGTSDQTYCYVVTYRRQGQDPCSSLFNESPPSNEVCLHRCPEPPCGGDNVVISGWLFTDEGFIVGGQNGNKFRSYTDPTAVTASPWSFLSENRRSLRISFENDCNCTQRHPQPNNCNTQIGTVMAVISVGGCNAQMNVMWSGLGEQRNTQFDLMWLYVDGVNVGYAHAPGQDPDAECLADMAPVVSVPPPPQSLNLAPGLHVLEIRTTTGDSAFHFGAYYQFNFGFQ